MSFCFRVRTKTCHRFCRQYRNRLKSKSAMYHWGVFLSICLFLSVCLSVSILDSPLSPIDVPCSPWRLHLVLWVCAWTVSNVYVSWPTWRPVRLSYSLGLRGDDWSPAQGCLAWNNISLTTPASTYRYYKPDQTNSWWLCYMGALRKINCLCLRVATQCIN